MIELWGLGVVFTSAALEPDHVRVVDITGHERLGQLYEFRVTFSHVPGSLSRANVDQLLVHPCSFTLGGGQDDVIHGIVRDVELVESFRGRPAVYVATVVPSVWLLTLSKVSRVFQDMSVAEMATELLVKSGLGASDFELRILGKADKREFCVQYEESDWDFLQRWFEYEGYYYWFEHGVEGEKLVIADVHQVSPSIVGDAQLVYREHGNLARTADSVFTWRGMRRRTPGRVVVKDYNEQNPSMPMVSQAKVGAAHGFGVLFAYGEHFDNPDVGEVIARKRAERCLVEHASFQGRTDCTRLRVGHTFELVEHFDEESNGAYMLTGVEHHVGLVEPALDGQESGGEPVYGYRASFDVIPMDVQFRPARTTPWPRIEGIMHAHVDSDTTGRVSTINGQGRYRVRLPFDSTGKCGERASNWVRMAQSYAGAGYGSHFPLHKGTEVVLAFAFGNPDRPMIIGAVPNAHTPGPTAAKNATQSIIQSASGIRFVMEDKHAPPPSSRRVRNDPRESRTPCL